MTVGITVRLTFGIAVVGAVDFGIAVVVAFELGIAVGRPRMVFTLFIWDIAVILHDLTLFRSRVVTCLLIFRRYGRWRGA